MTLAVGIVTSMFTAIWGTRALVNIIYGNRSVKKALDLGWIMSNNKQKTINFMKQRFIALAISAILLLASLILSLLTVCS